MSIRTKAASLAALSLLAIQPAFGATATLDFHLVFEDSATPPPGASSVPPFAGTATIDDSLFGMTDVTPETFSLQFFDRVVTGDDFFTEVLVISLSNTGELLAIDLAYDEPNILEINSTGSETLDVTFAYGQTVGGGRGAFVDGKIPSQPPTPPGAEVPLPATGFLLLAALACAAGMRRKG